MDEEEIKAKLDQQVAEGKLTQQQADAFLRAWWARQLGFVAPNITDTFGEVPNVSIVRDPASASKEDLENVVTHGKGILNEQTIAEAQAELEERARIEGLTFLQAVTDPAALKRVGSAALKGPSQIANAFTAAIPALALTGIGAATGSETAKEAGAGAFDKFARNNEIINEAFGTSDPIRPEESLAESVFGALVPGGIGAKAAGIATDFAVDQTVRELTDEDSSTYETVFDKIGVPEFGGINPLIAIPTAIVGSILTGKAVNALRNTSAITPPTLKDIHSFDKFAPTDLKTLEKSSDAITAFVIDQQTALTNVVKRAGLPDPEAVTKAITLNSGSAAHTRVREAVNSGFMNIDGVNYSVRTPVRTLFDGVMTLPQQQRELVEKFVNMNDMIDDARIALSKNIPGNHQQTIAQLTAQIRRIQRQFPLVNNFHRAYKEATAAVRDILEGDILDTKSRQWLDASRPNYVPLDISPVNKEAPFIERMIQTQRTGVVNPEDWFLQTRQGSGSYDPAVRGNPFELLAQYTEAALNLRLKNDLRKTIVDGLLNSKYGKETIRLVNENDDLAGNVNRLVQVMRDGKKETYITSQLTAELMKFDPYVAKHPGWFMAKRSFEQTAVGPASIVFAPITAIRDTIAGAVVRPAGAITGSPLQVAAAVPKQVWAKAKKAIASNIRAGLVSGHPIIPASIWDEASQAAFADKLSNQYINSLYHLANQSGGFDASIMKSNIVAAQNAFGEIRRTLREGKMLNNPALDNVVARFGKHGAATIIDGFMSLFNSIQDAPRYAALENTVKSGKSIDEAATLARSITGDVGRSGRVFDPTGRMIGFDAADRGITTLVTPTVGRAANFAREATPFVNPAIQGMRRMITSFADDPVGTMGRAWLYVGLPSITAYSWNEMLGEEYNEYSMSRRSSNDVAMQLYVGIPGQPPEKGIEIPLPHEMIMFSSPYTRALHSLVKGEDKDMTSAAIQSVGASLLGNTIGLSAPVALEAFANAAGTSLNGFLGLGQSYQIREDNIGLLPQNIENMARTLFSNVANTGMQIAYAMSQENDDYSDWNTFLDTVTNDVAKRAPILRNVTGRKTANVSFSIPAEIDRQKEAAIAEMWPYWDTFYNPEKLTEEGFNLVSASNYVKDKGAMEGRDDLSQVMPGPSNIDKPTNPLYELFGQKLMDQIRRNDIGISGLDDRNSKYKQYVAQLRAYNSGDRTAIAEWQEVLASVDNPESEETIKLKEFIDNFDLDLTKYTDRVKMINLIENERSYIIQQKIELVSTVENEITKELQAKGLLTPGENFRIEKHLKPFDSNPLGTIGAHQ